jgi:hypothetical protein
LGAGVPKGRSRLGDNKGEDGEEALYDPGAGGGGGAEDGGRQLALPEQEEEGLHRLLHVGRAHLALQHVEDDVEKVEHLLANLNEMRGVGKDLKVGTYI